MNRHCPPYLRVLRRYVAAGTRHASLPPVQSRCCPRQERRYCEVHTCKVALEVSGCGGEPLPALQGLHLSAGEFAQVTRARRLARGGGTGKAGGKSAAGEPGRVAHLPGLYYAILAGFPGEGGLWGREVSSQGLT